MKFKIGMTVMLILGITTNSQAQTASATSRRPVRAKTPVCQIAGYCVEGNTVLAPERLDFLTNYTGPAVNLVELQQALDKLQTLYRGLGCVNARVNLPRQHLTNGIVQVQVVEGIPVSNIVPGQTRFNSNVLVAVNSNKSVDLPPAGSAKPVTFRVVSYDIEGNTVLPKERFNFLTNYTGPAVDLARLRKGLGELQLLYRDLGFATVSVTLPQQRLTNGVVRVQVIEGKLASIAITGNRYFSSNNIQRALPSLKTNILINTKWLQPEINQANQNPDRQIYPVVSPGNEPGFTDLTLRVKDRLPLHGHIEVNDKSTPDTPLLRIDTALQYDNLWQLDHQIGLQYDFSPQDAKSASYLPRFYDQPSVASYSGFYRIPVGCGAGLREQYEQLPVNFGYNEVTHQFQLPQPSGNPELILYGSRSTSELPLNYGPLMTVISSPLVGITSQSAERDLTFTENIGGKYTLPLRQFAGIRSSLIFGFDFKSFHQWSYSTNLSYFTTTLTNGGVTSTSTSTIALPSNTHESVTYLPLSFGWSGDRPDAWGSTSFGIEQDLFLSPLESSRPNFQSVAGSKSAGDDYTKIYASAGREENLWHGWSLLGRLTGQWASEPLISNEEFPLGGTAGVRGYQEGEFYGDNGWRSSLDLRAPAVPIGTFPISRQRSMPAMARPSLFMDYGEGYLLDRTGQTSVQQWGTGFGLFVTAGENFNARLSLGWALLKTPVTDPGSLQAYFSVGLQF